MYYIIYMPASLLLVTFCYIYNSYQFSMFKDTAYIHTDGQTKFPVAHARPNYAIVQFTALLKRYNTSTPSPLIIIGIIRSSIYIATNAKADDDQ